MTLTLLKVKVFHEQRRYLGNLTYPMNIKVLVSYFCRCSNIHLFLGGLIWCYFLKFEGTLTKNCREYDGELLA